MRAVFERAKVILDGEESFLCLSIPHQDAQKFVATMKPKKYSVEIKEYRERRSLDANAYAWQLIGKLSAKVSTPKAPVSPEEIYRNCIRDVGDNYEVVPVQADKIEHWDRIWCAGHIGRFTEDLGPCRNIPGYHNIRTFLGSSDYDKAQMARLIDIIIQECREFGVEYLSPEELRKMGVLE